MKKEYKDIPICIKGGGGKAHDDQAHNWSWLLLSSYSCKKQTVGHFKSANTNISIHWNIDCLSHTHVKVEMFPLCVWSLIIGRKWDSHTREQQEPDCHCGLRVFDIPSELLGSHSPTVCVCVCEFEYVLESSNIKVCCLHSLLILGFCSLVDKSWMF